MTIMKCCWTTLYAHTFCRMTFLIAVPISNMSNPRVTGFRIPCSLYVPVDKLKEYYDKVKSNAEWFRKAYIYLVDEPIGIEGLNTLTSFCNRVRKTCPDIRIVCPYYLNIDITDSYDQTQYILETFEIPCPKPCIIN